MFRAAILRENTKDKVDIFLAETDTCPQNRYATSAALLHSHFTASILEGATGAKHWITRLSAYEPASGKAYRKKLAKYSKFYEALTGYAKMLHPFGCRIPLTLKQNYGFVLAEQGMNLSPWATCVLERFGIPLYFANEGEGAVFLDEFAVDGFSDSEIREFLRGTLVLTAEAASKLNCRGFLSDIGVSVSEYSGKVITGEIVRGVRLAAQYATRQLKIEDSKVEELSLVYHKNTQTEEVENLFPGVTRFQNNEGGETVVFSGTVDMPFKYFTAFSMLNETRKKQLLDILLRKNSIPVYYPEDAELYLRAGRLDSGELFAVAFNLSQDMLDELPLVIDRDFRAIERLDENGERVPCRYKTDGGVTYIDENVMPMEPIVIFIS